MATCKQTRKAPYCKGGYTSQTEGRQVNFANDEDDRTDYAEEVEEQEFDEYGEYVIATPSGRRFHVLLEPTSIGRIIATCEDFDDFCVEAATVHDVLDEVRQTLIAYEADGR